MLFVSFFQWWYGRGLLNQFLAVQRRLQNLSDMFSIGILFRTLFSPWKQIARVARRDEPLEAKFRAWLDTLISRFVGFWVRFFVIVAAFITLFVTTIFSIMFLVAWPVLPLMPIILLFFSVEAL